MGYRLALSPWWVPASVYACIFFVFAVAFQAIRWWQGDALSPRTIAIWAVGALVFGGLLAASSRKAREAYNRALDGLEGEDRSAAITAATRGPAPADQRVRHAALQLVQHTLGYVQRHRLLNIVLISVVIIFQLVIGIVGMLDDPPRDAAVPFLIAALFGIALFANWYNAHRLKRRAELLADTAEPASG